MYHAHQVTITHKNITEFSLAISKRGREEGDGTENVINCRKLSQIVMTFYDEFYDDF